MSGGPELRQGRWNIWKRRKINPDVPVTFCLSCSQQESTMPIASMKSKIPMPFLQLGLLCLLAGCSPEFVPPQTSPSLPPQLGEYSFVSFDGTRLPLRVWLPAGRIKGVIVALHGFNDYSNFIEGAAPFFTKHGLALYACDQRGFGRSASRGRWSGWQAMAADAATLTALIKGVYPQVPVYLLGDSMGGAVAIVAMAENHPVGVHGVILVAPAVWARSEMPWYQRLALWVAAHTIPWDKVTGQSLKIKASDNLEMLIKLGKDPLVIKQTRIDVLYGLTNLMDRAFAVAGDLKAPSLILYGEKDQIIPRKAIDDFYRRLPFHSRARQQMIIYKNGYHMLLRDLQSAKVLADIVGWIDKRNRSTTTVSARGHLLGQEIFQEERYENSSYNQPAP